jgi:pimeloyl-ACP methyl ester carboxylesterase
MLAVEAPELVSDLVIVASGATAPTLGGDLDSGWSAAAAAAYDVTGGCETVEEFLATNSRLSTTNPPEFVHILRANYRLARERGQLERFKAASMNGDYRQYKRLQEDLLLPHLSEASARILLVWAGADATVPVARGMKLLERVPQADMHILAGAAHMVMIDRAEAFNSLLLGWLPAGN